MSDTRVPDSGPVPGASPRGDADDVSKREVIEHFGVLLAGLEGLLVSMIGADATAAVLWSALLTARREYPVLHELEVSEAGGHVDQLQANLRNVDGIELQNSLTAYIDGIVALIADITGEVVVLKIAPLIQQFQQRLEG